MTPLGRRLHILTFAAAVLLSACVTVKPPTAIPAPDYKEASRTNTQLGVAYLQQGDLKVAKDKLDRAIEQDPSYPKAHEVLAMLFAQRGDTDEAEKEFRRAMRLDDSDPGMKNNFAIFLCQNGKRDEAVNYFKQAAQDLSYATPEAAWTNLGMCLMQHGGDAAEAEHDFREALRINPNFPNALARMASISYQRQDYLGARAFLQRYERVGAATPETLLTRTLVERQLGDRGVAHDYQVELLRKFPESPQAQAVLKENQQ